MLTITNHPILKAHVFYINPKIKKSWVSASREAASVSFFLDNSTGLYSVFSVEKCKQIIKSLITADTIYNRTSFKFIQWRDTRNDVIFGLSFSCVTEIQSFIDSFDAAKLHATKILEDQSQFADNQSDDAKLEAVKNLESQEDKYRQNFFQKFDEAKLHAAKILRQPQQDIESSTTPIENLGKDANKENFDGYIDKVMQQVEILIPHNESAYILHPHNEGKQQKTKDKGANNFLQHPIHNEEEEPVKILLAPTAKRKSQDYTAPNLLEELNNLLIKDFTPDNEKLLFTLADYAANEKIFEAQLATLKKNKARIKSALSESAAKVEEYKKQLRKERNARKCRFDVGDCKDKVEEDSGLRKEIQLLRLRVEQLEKKLDIKNSKANLVETAADEVDTRQESPIIM